MEKKENAFVIAIANPTSNVGKSSCCVWLAGVLAIHHSQRVCIIDGIDPKKRILKQRQKDQEKRMVNFLYAVKESNFEEIEENLTQLRVQFDIILIDFPSDGREEIMTLLALCDGLLIPLNTSEFYR